MHNVSKQIFLNSLVCPALGWLMRSRKVSREPTIAEKFRMEQGLEIGRRARSIYSEGILIDDSNIESAANTTKNVMNDPSVNTIFEGTFFAEGLVTRADVLKRSNGSWQMVEVKSSVNDKEEFIDDMAYTVMVIDRLGFDVSNVFLLLMSKDFRLGMGNNELFLKIDHTGEVLGRVEVFKPYWESIEEITRQAEKPESELQFECRKCFLFKECFGKGIENHIFEIPRISKSKFSMLMESGIECINDIPDGFSLTENQSRVVNSVKAGQPKVETGLEHELASIIWPAFYLDFETVSTAIPLYPNIAPYTQLPTQYSIHVCSNPGEVINHFEYLSDPRKDCRRELTEKLIDNLRGEGSIIAYSTFEKRIINGLGSTFPDLLTELSLLIDRIVDLEAIIKKNYYHPEFHGSTSIKRTLPALVLDLTYDGLEIADGDSAMAVFSYLAMNKYVANEIDVMKRNLLEYCKRDTMAMVKLHHHLTKCLAH